MNSESEHPDVSAERRSRVGGLLRASKRGGGHAEDGDRASNGRLHHAPPVRLGYPTVSRRIARHGIGSKAGDGPHESAETGTGPISAPIGPVALVSQP